MEHHPRFSAPLSLLFLFSLSLMASALGGLMNTPAVAQQAPVTGNVYQTQQGLEQQAGPENVMIILDSSDSMSEKIGGGESKMIAAKRTVLEVMRNVPATTRVGLRVYGDSSSPFTACSATRTLVPLGENNRNLISSKMIGIQPTGMTPISLAIQRSLDEDFRLVAGRKSIILISDGIETCGEDPCNLAVRMQQTGIPIKINVVGLGLQDYAANKQLRCVALGTKGKFYSANTAAELANSLNQALAIEAKVQGTILTPMTSIPSVPAAQNQPPQAEQSQKQYQETVLPAAVPIKPNKR